MPWKWLDKIRGIEDRIKESDGRVYLLKENEMVEQGVEPKNRYSAHRSDVRKSLRTLDWLPYTHKRTVHMVGVSVGVASGESFVKIGCQYFSGENADRLSAWASKA